MAIGYVRTVLIQGVNEFNKLGCLAHLSLNPSTGILSS